MNIPYKYEHLSVPGGGFVTGVIFHPKTENILYIRTDIGGIYKYDFSRKIWNSLSSVYNEFQKYLYKPLSLALDVDHSERLFAVCGDCALEYNPNRVCLLISEDGGLTFTEKPVPFRADGNFAARSTDERLAYWNNRLYFGSQRDGLYVSEDLGDNWSRLDFPEPDITFVRINNYGVILVGCTGEALSKDNIRGNTLYMSYDNGTSFKSLKAPPPLLDERCFYKGFVPVSVSFYDKKAVVSFSSSKGDSYAGWDSFACDNGGGFDGRLYYYEISSELTETVRDITPNFESFSDINPKRKLPFGLGGVEITEKNIYVCAIGAGDIILRSDDNGVSFQKVLGSHQTDSFDITTPYQKPEYNGGHIPLHWMSSFRISPHNPDFGLFNTGTGVFASHNLTEENTRFKTFNEGIEETVHLNIYGVSKGKNKVIDIIGDLGGFAFRELGAIPENSFADRNGNRYITCNNADYLDSNPDIFVSTARGNWTGKTMGGLIYTTDGGDCFTHLGYPENIGGDIDYAVSLIKQPNKNAGWAAISSDNKIIAWSIAYNHLSLPISCAVRYEVDEKRYSKINVFDIKKSDISYSKKEIKIFSDRIKPDVFYGFGENGQLYISRDYAESFYEINSPWGDYFLSGIDGRKQCEIRLEPNKSGIIWLALNNFGLWKVTTHDNTCDFEKVSTDGDFVKTVGFGKGISDDIPAIFITGTLSDEYGFWRSADYGKSFDRINDDKQMYGGIVSVDGDMNDFGKVYIATNSYGALWGKPKQTVT